MISGKRAVLLDLDGTLVDSEDFIVWTFVEAGRLTGITVDSALVRSKIGEPLDSVIDSILAGVSRDKVEEFIRVRRELVRRNWKSMVRLFPDVHPALESLKKKGFLLGVASSSVVERIVEFLAGLGVLHYFDVISGVRPGIRGKPDPDVIINAIAELGVTSSESVYVGDREVDCIASARAGVDFVLVDRSSTSRQPSNWSCRPTSVVGSLIELATLLE